MNRKVEIAPDAAALVRRAAQIFADAAKRAVETNGRFTVVLSGGSTPKALYSLLTGDPELRAQVPWKHIFFFLGDERCVPPDHADSNFGAANEGLFRKIGTDRDHVFRMKGEIDPETAAAEYEQELRSFFSLEASQVPRFDLVLLGMGPDGHTASLFPGTRALEERSRLVVANWVEKFHAWRLTMTAPVLNHAAMVLFMVHGEDKAAALKSVLEGPRDPAQFPAQLVQAGEVVWVVDASAAGLL